MLPSGPVTLKLWFTSWFAHTYGEWSRERRVLLQVRWPRRGGLRYMADWPRGSPWCSGSRPTS